MKKNIKYFFTIFFAFLLFTPMQVFAHEDMATNEIGFKKSSIVLPEDQIKNIFAQYQKYSNKHDVEKTMSFFDATYRSSDGLDKSKLKDLITESWTEYPNIKYSLKILSINVDVDNATVMTKEKFNGTTSAAVPQFSGTGNLFSESTAIYYLKKFSNEWRIISDFVITEKSSIKYGIAKYVPMQIDAPGIVAPNEDYTAILKISLPADYIALSSINNELITYPAEKKTETFRPIKEHGILERILTGNDESKNENAIASVGIAKLKIGKKSANINLLGVAFLSTRVNVVKHEI